MMASGGEAAGAPSARAGARGRVPYVRDAPSRPSRSLFEELARAALEVGSPLLERADLGGGGGAAPAGLAAGAARNAFMSEVKCRLSRRRLATSLQDTVRACLMFRLHC